MQSEHLQIHLFLREKEQLVSLHAGSFFVMRSTDYIGYTKIRNARWFYRIISTIYIELMHPNCGLGIDSLIL